MGVIYYNNKMYACGSGGNTYGGNAIPDDSIGTEGDYYYQYDLTTGDVQITYVKLNDVWHKIAGGDVIITGGIVTVTQNEYDALSQAEKTNGTVYMINGVSENISILDVTLRQQSSTATHYTNDGTAAQFSRGSGSSIGLGFFKSIDVTDLESIEFQLSVSSFYGNHSSYPTNDRFALSVSIGDNAFGTDYNIYPTKPKVIQFFEYTFTNKKFRLDVSELTGIKYLNVLGSGVECTVGNFKAYTNDQKIMYMDNKYLYN
jgi:hypothetical protein